MPSLASKTIKRPRNCGRIVITLEFAIDPADCQHSQDGTTVVRERMARVSNPETGKLYVPLDAIEEHLDALDIEIDRDLVKVEVTK